MMSKLVFGKHILIIFALSALSVLRSSAQTPGSVVADEFPVVLEGRSAAGLQILVSMVIPDLSKGPFVFQDGNLLESGFSDSQFAPQLPFCVFEGSENVTSQPLAAGRIFPLLPLPAFQRKTNVGEHVFEGQIASWTLDGFTEKLWLWCGIPKSNATKTASAGSNAPTVKARVFKKALSGFFAFEHEVVKSQSSEVADFTVNSLLHLFQVLVLDEKSGKPRDDLEKEDFLIYEDCLPESNPSCRPTPIDKIELSRDSQSPVDFAIAVDLSGSTSGVRGLMEDAVRSLLSATSENHQAALLTYSDSSMVCAKLGNPRILAKSSISFSRCETGYGNSCGLCGLGESIEYLKKHGRPGARKVVILVTDGIYQMDPPTEISLAQRSGVTVFSVDVGRGGDWASANLRAVAEGTGGMYFLAAGYQDLGLKLLELLQMWSTYYIVDMYGSVRPDGTLPSQEIRIQSKDPVRVYINGGVNGPQVAGRMKGAAEGDRKKVEEELKRKSEAKKRLMEDNTHLASTAQSYSDLIGVLPKVKDAPEAHFAISRLIDHITGKDQVVQLLSGTPCEKNQACLQELKKMLGGNGAIFGRLGFKPEELIEMIELNKVSFELGFKIFCDIARNPRELQTASALLSRNPTHAQEFRAMELGCVNQLIKLKNPSPEYAGFAKWIQEPLLRVKFLRTLVVDHFKKIENETLAALQNGVDKSNLPFVAHELVHLGRSVDEKVYVLRLSSRLAGGGLESAGVPELLLSLAHEFKALKLETSDLRNLLEFFPIRNEFFAFAKQVCATTHCAIALEPLVESRDQALGVFQLASELAKGSQDIAVFASAFSKVHVPQEDQVFAITFRSLLGRAHELSFQICGVRDALQVKGLPEVLHAQLVKTLRDQFVSHFKSGKTKANFAAHTEENECQKQVERILKIVN